MKRALIFLFLIALVNFSCQKKILQGPTKIMKGSEFYGYTAPNGPPPAGTPIVKYSIVDPSLKATVREVDGMLFIKPLEVNSLPKPITVVPIPDPTDFNFSTISGKYYFPEGKDNSSKESFRYRTSGIAIQTLGIPFKFRGSINDTLPRQVETGFSGTLSVAWKFNWNVFRPEKNYLGKNTNTISLALGIIPIGLGTVTLKKENTFSEIVLPRTALVYSNGAFVMFGVNNINFGIAGGFDWATGPEASKWMYQKKPWAGIVVGFDILK